LSLALAAALLAAGVGAPPQPAADLGWVEQCPARNRSFTLDRCVMRLRTVDAELAVWADGKEAWVVLTSFAREADTRAPCHLEGSQPIPKMAAELPPKVLIARLNQSVTMMEAGRECHVVELPQFREADRGRLIDFLARAHARLTVSEPRPKRGPR
jgi:hypothetical protein